MATQTKTLAGGVTCTRVIVQDAENEVRIHLHDDDLWPKGVRVTSAALGALCEIGEVEGECDG